MVTQAIPSLSVAEVVLQFPHALNIFNQYRIDYCCGGNLSFQEACARAGIDVESVWNEINFTTTSIDGPNFNKWSISLLIDYIVDQHHSYVRDSIPVLQELLQKLCDVHGRHHPELYDILEKFNLLAEELLQHMHKEEHILFPAMKFGMATPMPLQGPIHVMLREHQLAGDLVKEIRSKSRNYTCPDDVCTTYRLTLQKLEAFDNDLMQHIHLENNILFRKVS